MEYYDLEKNRVKPKPTVLGVGYDSGGKWKPTELVSKGKHRVTPEYRAWTNMLRRCYDEKSASDNPTYAGCSVAEEWHDFQVFAEWLTSQEFYGIGYQLDKDILVRGNRVYSPETCSLIPKAINMLFADCRAARGELPIGVHLFKKTGQYMAQVRMYGKSVYLGIHDSVESAHRAYVKAKEKYVKEVAEQWRGKIEERVYYALMNWTVE